MKKEELTKQKEIWKPVAGYEGLYEVSNEGNVRSLKSGRWRNRRKILTPRKIDNGYHLVALCKDGTGKQMYVHRLVAQAFIPNPNNLETVNHKDEVKTNNNVSNLEWMSHKDNNNFGTRNRRIAEARVNHPKLSKLVQMLDKSTGELLETFPSMDEARRVTGIAQSSIYKCCRGKLKSAGGYVWKYA